jgi:type II secretory ATPase GspE/PulE/Tfp pilus assembly ATPase PilB-like protein
MSCSYCNGVWLGAGDLSRVHGHSQDLQGAIEVEARGQGLKCPHCDLVMGLAYLPNSGGLDVVRCRHCQGIWFDTDGLKLALGAIRRSHGSPLPAVAASEPVETIEQPDPTLFLPATDTVQLDPGQRASTLQRLKRQREDALSGAASIESPAEAPRASDIPSAFSSQPGNTTIELLNSLLKQAVESGASDIHFEGVREELRIRMRVDGQLRVTHLFPKANQSPLIARLQVLCNLNTANPWIPQDGSFSTWIKPA